jgi:hypothetical protein
LTSFNVQLKALKDGRGSQLMSRGRNEDLKETPWRASAALITSSLL